MVGTIVDRLNTDYISERIIMHNASVNERETLNRLRC